MSDTCSRSELQDGWAPTAIQYVEEEGWEVVPLHSNLKNVAEDVTDRVVRQLGAVPIVDVPEGVITSEEEVYEWNDCHPSTSPLAIQTGAGSGLVAVEVGPAAERALDATRLRKIKKSFPETRCVCGPDRDYYLFSIPEGLSSLPRMTRSDGIILHGQNSLIRVPKLTGDSQVSPYRWDIGTREIAPFPTGLFSFFGLKTGPGDLSVILGGGRSGRLKEGQREWASPSRQKQEREEEFADRGSITFSSGEDLKVSNDDTLGEIGIPWLSTGTISVLAGSPKESGKSTFVVNLAAHLAGGHSFLEYKLNASPVVALTDLPRSHFRTLLQRIGIGREARSNIHTLHPRDASEANWKSLLSQTFEHATQVGASLVVLDSLDRYVQVKGGVDPCANDDFVHFLTTEVPSSCALLAVKALRLCSSKEISETIDTLGMLGTTADVVAQMDAGPTGENRLLRRLQFAGRLAKIPTHLLCEMKNGRYQRVRQGRQTGIDASVGDGEPLPKRPRGESEDLPFGNGKRKAEATRLDPRPSVDRQAVSTSEQDSTSSRS